MGTAFDRCSEFSEALYYAERDDRFAVVGIGLLLAILRPALRPIAVCANAISFGGFLVLVIAGGPVGPGLMRVAAFDVVGLVALGVGVACLRDERPVERSACRPAAA